MIQYELDLVSVVRDCDAVVPSVNHDPNSAIRDRLSAMINWL